MLVANRAGNAAFGAQRTGAVVPLMAFMMAAMIGFLALAIDIGMLTISKTQAQNAADLAALTAARTLNGDTSNNYNQSLASTNACAELTWNNVLGQPISAPAPSGSGYTVTSGQVTLSYGSYDYNQSTQSFKANFPPTVGTIVNGKNVYVPTSAVTASVTTGITTGPTSAFGGFFGTSNMAILTATATAVHRPRDIVLTLDQSGSMRFGTLSRFDFASGGLFGGTISSNNPDTNVPSFGHYSSGSAALTYSGGNRTGAGNYTIVPSNITATNASYTQTYINGFYSNAAYAPTLIRAFSSETSGDGGSTWSAGSGSPTLPPTSYATTPGGDVPLYKKNTTSYAQTVNGVVGSTSFNLRWEVEGYSGYYQGKSDDTVLAQTDYSPNSSSPPKVAFNGYTQGPGYYGKTFFVWPPDPRAGALTGASAATYLTKLGVKMTDVSYLTTGIPTPWDTWQGLGITVGMTKLQTWLQPASPNGTPSAAGASIAYTTSSPYVSDTSYSANTTSVYSAVCRLFSRGNPAGNKNPAFVADWRQRFFSTNDNTVLFDTGNYSFSVNNLNGGSFSINYSPILQWIQNIDASGTALQWTPTSMAPPNPFPTQMRAGRIKYYGSIPTSITGSWPDWGNTDQRFWRECINNMLGLYETSSGQYMDISSQGGSAMSGYAPDFTWGNPQVVSPPNPPQYMDYNDNPARGQLRYWFGPLMMVDYLGNMNMWESSTQAQGNYSNLPYFVMDPGDGYSAPQYSGKQAFSGAIATMQTNHPNDWFSLIFYNWPRSQATDQKSYNCASCPLGTNYAYASSALFFPLSTINANGTPNNTEVTPYDADPVTGNVPSANFVDVPRPFGSTCFSMALMLAYNQFIATPTSDSTLRTFVTGNPITFGYGGDGTITTAGYGMAGGMGRKGAQKIVIFETDGIPQYHATANQTSFGGTGYSPTKYYKIRYDMNKPNSSEYPNGWIDGTLGSSSLQTEINGLVTKLSTDFGTTRNPFRLYAIGFGPVFAKGAPDYNLGITVLTGMQNAGGVATPPATVTGTDTVMTAQMTAAFTNVLQNGIQIALVK